MDNDDNDYEGQNLHVVGEERSKTSSVLRPYALPKFDFDDSLQVHLRFDSLVENEVFLGIPSQEDNHWIEDFSRGSSGIEFSSSAAESCSIPRRNNVWSEATSSESVEMLLKSVGQEEMVPGESVIEESDVRDELGSSVRQMEPNLRHDEKRDSQDTNQALPTGEFLGNASGVIQSAGVAVIDPKVASETKKIELSALECSGVNIEKSSLVLTEENVQTNLTFDSENQEKSDTSLNESLSNRMKEALVNSETQSNMECSSHDITVDVGNLSGQDKVSDEHLGSVSNQPVEICEGVEEQSSRNNESSVNDESLSRSLAHIPTSDNDSQLYVASKMEASQEHDVETNTTSFEESSSFPKNEASVLPTAVGNNQDLHSVVQGCGNSVVLVISETTEIKESTDKREKSSVTSQGDDEVDMHAIERSGVEAQGIYADLELAKGSLLQTSHEHGSPVEAEEVCVGSLSEMDRVTSDTTSEAHMSRVDCELHKKVNESNTNYVDDVPGLTTASFSAELVAEKHVLENPKEDDDVAGVHVEVLLPSVQAGMQRLVDNISSDKIDVLNSEQDASVCEKTDRRNLDSEAVGPINDAKRVPSLSLDENAEAPPGFKLDKPMMLESVSNAGMSNKKIVSVETSDALPSLSVNGATEEATNLNEEQESPSCVVVSVDVDKQEEMEVGVLSEVNISNLKESVCIEGEPPAVSESEKSTSSNIAAEVVIKVDHSVGTGEISASQDVEAIADKEISRKESSNKTKVDPVHCGSKLAEAENAEAAAIGKHQETKIENNDGTKYSEVSGGGNFAKTVPSQDSATVSCTELSKTTKRAQEGPMKAGIENVSLSGSTCEVGGKTVSTPVSGGVNDTSREERSFTFDVRPLPVLPEGETGMGWQSFPNIKACKMSTIEKVSASTSSNGQKDHKAVQDTSHATPRAPESRSPSRGAKSTSERKTRRGSGKAGKDSKKGDIVKETPVRQSEREDKQSALVSPLGAGQNRQIEVGITEQSGAKSTAVVSVPTSNLPDLNTSVPTSSLYHQPFTDLQQVQLRAQIFVYGSLIQGAAPDEACMISAFGTSDGGRSVWESLWRACVERLHGQKSIANNYDTPVQSFSGSKAQDHSSKQGLPQSKVLPSPASRLSSKGSPSPAVNPMIPLSSPLWNISTPSCDGLPSSSVARGAVLDYQALPPLHPYQTPPMKTFGAHTTSWLSQAPFPGPWVASQSSPFDFSARFSSLPTTETVKLTPVKDPSMAISSGAKHVSTTPLAHGGGSSTFGGATMPDVKRMTGSAVQHSADPKSRKRKKSNITEDPAQIPLAATFAGAVSSPVISSHSSKKGPVIEEFGPISLRSRNQTESVIAPVIGGHFSTSVAVTASPSCVPKSSSDKFLVATSPASLSTDHSKRGDSNVEKIAIHGENFSKVEEAKRQAEEAAAHAASAVNHCQSVWNQLDAQRNSGLMSGTEEKLASAAVAIAAAASVAKAAAAAAKIASRAAVQAKQMADEALISNRTNIPVQESSIPNVMNNLGNANPASILKGADGNKGSNLIISAAREAARRRVEATSAASRHAENLDAIVKAAELAAEAVSQAGIVVAMGKPLPLSVLVEAGPERYWQGSEVPSGDVVKYSTENGDKRNNESFTEVAKQSKGPSDQGMHTTDRGRSPISREISRNMEEDNIRTKEDASASVGPGEKDLSGKTGRRASDLAKAITSMPETGSGLTQGAQENVESIVNDNGIKEGCLVEVFKDGGHFKGAWYSANVLSLDIGKAFVCYSELQSDEGSGLLREWVPLEGEGIEVPIIRIPHPMSSMRFEGTRKRRRAAVRDYNWSVGDRVDVWVEDCWREGVITEKNKKDETSLTVHFPAQGETSVVRAWHLRPTLMWKNGEWIELPSSSQNASSQSDTPQDKRQKLGSPAIEVKGKGKVSRSMDVDVSEKDEPKLLPLSANEKVFNIGSNRDGNKADAPRIMRSGLQKEGSKVIFGVPKPGKKRKFMEVSKHYVSEVTTKTSVSNDSVKVSKYPMSQGPGSRAWRNNSKVDSKEKPAAETKSRPPKSGKLPSFSSRTLPQKEKSSLSSVAATLETTKRGLIVNDSISKDVNESGRQNLTEFGSVSNMEEAAEVPISSQALPSDATKKASTNAKSERLTKGKFVPAGGKSTKVEVKDNPIPEAIEPRRSNRRIQPTSRLLEGLQSSLIISKIPSVSHDKSHSRGASRGTNNHG